MIVCIYCYQYYDEYNESGISEMILPDLFILKKIQNFKMAASEQLQTYTCTQQN